MSKVILVLVITCSYESKMWTSLPVSSTGTCSRPLNCPHWFTINVLSTKKTLSMCYPLKIACDFSVGDTLIVETNSVIARPCVPTQQYLKGLIFSFIWVLKENLKLQVSLIKTDNWKISWDSKHFAGCLYSNGKWYNPIYQRFT